MSIPKHILWWGNSLRYGGVERQILATAREFAHQGIGLSLICHKLHSYMEESAFLPQAEALFQTVYDFGAGSASLLKQMRHYWRDVQRGLKEERKTGAEAPLWRTCCAVRKKLHARKAVPLYAFSPSVKEGKRLASACPLSFGFEERAVLARYTAFFLEQEPDLLHSWNADHVIVPLAALLAGVPRVVIGLRSLSPRTRFQFGFESADDAANYAALSYILGFPGVSLLANSRAGAKDYAAWLGLSSDAVLVLHNIFDFDSFMAMAADAEKYTDNFGIPQGAPVVGGLFRMTSVKDPFLWVESACKVLDARPDAFALLGGDGEMLEQCKRLAAPYGGRFFFPGHIRNAAALYAACSVFLLTSHVEGLPNVLLEAQYAGVPVVSTNAGGAAETVLQGESGWIVYERDAAKLAEAVLSVLNEPERARAAGCAGRLHIEQNFAPQCIFEDLLAVYRNGGAVL